jgi:hypothetical protein
MTTEPSPTADATRLIESARDPLGDGLDPAHQVVRHARGEGLPAHEHVHVRVGAGEEDGGLPGGVAAAHDDRLLALDQPGLDGGRGVVGAAALETAEVLDAGLDLSRVWQGWPPVDGAKILIMGSVR